MTRAGFLDERIFSVDGVTFTGRAVIAAARRWGDWAKLEDDVRQGLACAACADDTEDDADDEALETAARDFRYGRDLVSGQELQAWLDRWALDLDAWTEYLRRALLRQRWG